MYGLRGSAAAKTVKNVIKPKPSPQRLRNPHSKVLTVLGVETSADDSCAAVVTSDRRILSNVVIRQDEYHEPNGGIQPLVAIEAHQRNLPGAVQQALDEAGMSLQDVDGIAYTRGPGIGGCLSVGSNAMRTLAAAMKKPLVAVHHMQAHALTPFLTEPIDSLPTYPFLSLLISGGHTLLLLANSPRDFKILATATDEAIGRTIDKVARALQIPWGERGFGPSLEEYLRAGPPEGYKPEEGYELPLYVTPMPGRLQFAFAALHSVTEVYMRERDGSIDECTRYAVASAFQRAVLRHLEDKLDLALRHCSRERIPIRHLVVSGGVASNIYLRERLFEYLEEQTHFGHPIDLVFPPVSLCTDNAAMIAWASMDRFLSGNTDPYTIDLKAKWSIEDLDAPPFNTMFPTRNQAS